MYTSAAGRTLWPRVGTSGFDRDNSQPVQTLVVMIGQNPLWIGMEVENKECVRGIVMIGLAINTPGSPCPRITVPSNSGTSYRGRERDGGADIGSLLERI